MYFVELSQLADKFLNKLDKHLSERIITKLRILEKEQVPSDAKFITRHDGEKVFRIRIGDYRAMYKIKEHDKVVLIVKIDKRPRVYD